MWKPYMMIRVAIDVRVALKRWKMIKFLDGVSTKVTFQYERLYHFYFLCGKLDHSESYCIQQPNSQGGSVEKGWGVWLKAQDQRVHIQKATSWLHNEGEDDQFGGVTEDVAVSGIDSGLRQKQDF
ncbi:hypothetical protein ACS0TY_009963 [Phlomoides rotata]